MSNHEGLRRIPSVLNLATSKLETEAAIESMEREVHNLFEVPVPIEDWEVVTGKIRSDKARGVIVVVCVGALWSLPCRVHFSNWGIAATDPRMPKDDVQVHFVDHETRRGSSISSGVPIGLPVTVVYYNGKPIKFTEGLQNGSSSSLMAGANASDGSSAATSRSSGKPGDGSSCIVKMFSVDDCISLVTIIKDRVSLMSPMTSTSSSASTGAPGSSILGGVAAGAGGAGLTKPRNPTGSSLSGAAASIVVVGNKTSRMTQGMKGKQQQQVPVRVTNTTSYSSLPLHSDEEVVVRLNF